MALNKVMLIGNVGHTPEVKNGDNGKWAKFTIATTDRAYVKDGVTIPERTEWHNIVVNGKTAEVVEKYVNKGSKLYLEGKLRSRKYTDKNGIERTTTEIYCTGMELLTPKEKTQQDAPVQPVAQSYGQAPQPQTTMQPLQDYTASDNLPF